MSLADEIKRLRSLKGLTQKQLAAAAGVSQPFVHDLEHGIKKSATPEKLGQLAAALGVTRASLARFAPADSAAALAAAGELPFLGPVAAGPVSVEVDTESGEVIALAEQFPAGSAVFRVSGVSMEARGIFDGDLAVVKLTDDPADVNDGDIVVAKTDGSITLKAADKRSDRDIMLLACYRDAAPRPVRPGEDGVELVGVLLKVIGERRMPPARRKKK